MINDSQSITQNQSDEVVLVTPTFYVVSRKKLAILYMATLGLYGVYWFYKNWSNYKHRTSDNSDFDRSIWPVARGIFSIFFTHALFREVKAYGRDKAKVAEWVNESQATMLVLLMFVANVLDRLSFRSVGSPYSDLASLVILIPVLSQLLGAQDMINTSCGDPDGTSNSRFTKANYAWIVVGLLIWVMAIVGMFLPN
jgi:hypothetical protein